jgi:hypothetical protein
MERVFGAAPSMLQFETFRYATHTTTVSKCNAFFRQVQPIVSHRTGCAAHSGAKDLSPQNPHPVRSREMVEWLTL